mmetsp:Transcript_77876/g.252052  ORF Transcript_77876/g.252052 Transcript_77876/m.252052 type:complete len:221 (+) Transcript_77876:89-751(+)
MFNCVSSNGTRELEPNAEELLGPGKTTADVWRRVAAEERRYRLEEQKQQDEAKQRADEAEALRKAEEEARQQTQDLASQVREAQRAFKEEQARYEQLRRERELAEHTAAARHSEAKRLLQERERWVRKTAVAAFLKEHGCKDVNSPKQSLFKTTYPLHLATESANAKMVEMLIREGADLEVKNSWGRTALQVAKDSNSKDSHTGVLRVLAAASRARSGGA